MRGREGSGAGVRRILRNPQIRALSWTGGGDLLGKVALGGLTAVAGRGLSPRDFAIFVGLVASGVLAAAVWDLGASTLLSREVAASRASASDAMRQAAVFRLRTCWVWLVIFVPTVFVLIGAGASQAPAIAGIGIGSILSAISILPLAAARARGYYPQASACLATGRATSLAAVIPMFVFRPPNALLWLGTALALGELVVLVFSVVLLRRSAHFPVAINKGGGAIITFRKAVPLAVNSMLATAYNRYDVILLPALASLGQLAAYAPASRVQDVLFLIPSAFTVVATPHLSRLFGRTNTPEETGRAMRRFIAVGLAVALPVSALCFIFADSLLVVFLGPHYGAAVPSVRILVWFLPFATVEAPVIAALIAANRAGQTTVIFFVTFGAALILHLALDHRFGAVGASFASLVRDPVGLAVALILARRLGLLSRR